MVQREEKKTTLPQMRKGSRKVKKTKLENNAWGREPINFSSLKAVKGVCRKKLV